jgi:hypothetical protein
MYAPSPAMFIDLGVTRPSVSRPSRSAIHILDDDSLLKIFYFCRPGAFEQDQYGLVRWGNWGRERWWYKPVQVCRRWRYLILDSASHLGLCLVCTHGTPVADMLAHSPPFPLVIDYDYPKQDLAAEEEEGIMFALQHRDRVCRINLRMPVPGLQKVITALDDEFPMLEYLYIAPPIKHNSHFIFPATFEAPQLRLFILGHFAFPIGSPLLTTAVGLVILALRWIHPSTYPHPNHLLQPLSLLPQLETLELGFRSPIPNREIERQLSHIPIVAHVTLPNLHWFSFRGISAYFEALLPHMAIPILERFRVQFFNQLRFSVPRLLQFMTATENLRFSSVRFLFYHEAVAVFVTRVGTEIEDFFLQVWCRHLDWQVSSTAQIFNVLSPLLSAVAELNLDYREHTLSSEGHNQADSTQWRGLLGSFRNVKTLRVHKGLVGELSRSLQLDGESSLDLLPELNELVCSAGSVDDKTFSAFIHEREAAGKPINLIVEVSPVNREVYLFISSTGRYNIDSDPVLPR